MYPGNGGYNYTIPSCLSPGYYLVRHEIIALHSAWGENGAQFYPNCHQLEVSGKGTIIPTDLVSFPGAYQPDDPGIFINVWNRKSIYQLIYTMEGLGIKYRVTKLISLAGTYFIPGPAVFACPEEEAEESK